MRWIELGVHFFCVTQLSIFPVPTFVLYCLWWVTVLTLGMDRVLLFHVIVRMDCSVMKQTANSSETEISQETGELSEILSHVTWMRLPNVGSLGVSGISFHSKLRELYSIVFAVSYSARLSRGTKCHVYWQTLPVSFHQLGCGQERIGKRVLSVGLSGERVCVPDFNIEAPQSCYNSVLECKAD